MHLASFTGQEVLLVISALGLWHTSSHIDLLLFASVSPKQTNKAKKVYSKCKGVSTSLVLYKFCVLFVVVWCGLILNKQINFQTHSHALDEEAVML